MKVRATASVLADVQGRPERGSGIRVVGVDGPSGSGKSALARALSEFSGAPVVCIDDFLSWTDLESWWPRFQREVLKPLLAGHDAHYRVRDWHGDELGSSLAGWRTTPWRRLVIVDGVTCTRLAAAEALAYRIWVDAPEEVRLQRGLARDGQTHRELWKDWLTREAEFFRRDDTRARADLLISTGADVPHDPATEVVVTEP